MKKREGLTLVDVMTIFIAIFIILLVGMLLLSRLNRGVSRIVCGTNLKGLATAMIVYANDYDDSYPKLGKGPWSKKLGYRYDDTNFKPSQYEGPCTITSSLYMLVREADVSPKSFICPQQSNQTEFDGQNSKNLDIVNLWDFGPDPYKHVSYAYHNPYGKYPADGGRSAAFAVMANMTPWMKDGNFIGPNSDKKLPPQVIDAKDAATLERGNSLNHTEYKEDFLYFFQRTRHNPHGFGQNVSFADGHTSFEKQPNVGREYDNIYTFWSTEKNPTDQDRQGGTAPTNRSPENDAKSTTDSFLVL